MAEESDDAGTEGRPLTRPAFLIAAVVVAVIVLLGVTAAIRVARSDTTTAPPPASSTSASAAGGSSPDQKTGNSSVCGLGSSRSSNSLTVPPAVTWSYQGTTAYAKSPEFGPGEVADQGYRYCFQHSPAGAVVMASNALAQGADPETGDRWAKYALAEGRHRSQLLDQLGKARGAEGTRIKVEGFRVLSYAAESARVDIGLRVASQNQDLNMSGVYELVWQGGDWKISADVERPLDLAAVPDLVGYVPWGE